MFFLNFDICTVTICHDNACYLFYVLRENVKLEDVLPGIVCLSLDYSQPPVLDPPVPVPKLGTGTSLDKT